MALWRGLRSRTVDEQTAERELAAIFAQWLAAIPDEPDFFERTLADDWVYVDVSGSVRRKADYIPSIKAVPPGVRLELDALRVRLLGDVALVHGDYRVLGHDRDGTETVMPTRFTAVWAHREGDWQALAHHATAIGRDERYADSTAWPHSPPSASGAA
jgi:ketosteroid isomerase-like protein